MATKLDDTQARELPPELWTKVATHLPIADKLRLAQVSQSGGLGVAQSWRVADYFECAGTPEKPERLQVAHAPAAPHDAKKWLSLTQQMHLSKSAGGEEFAKVRSDKPVKMLVALAQRRGFGHLADEMALWPHYKKALTAASRPVEAAVFAGLMNDYQSLVTALGQGDLPAVERLLAAHMPLPDRGDLKVVLTAHPHLAGAVTQALVKDGSAPWVGYLFATGHEALRAGILDTAEFRDTGLFVEIYRQVTSHAASEALAHLMARWSPEQKMHIIATGAEPGAPVGHKCISDIVYSNSTQARADMLAMMLPEWMAAGGNPMDILMRRPLEPALIDVLANHGACPRAALLRITLNRFRDCPASYSAQVGKLLAYGARLTYQEFTAFVERHRDEADAFEKPYGFGRMLRLFEKHDAIPLRNGTFGNKYSAPDARSATGLWAAAGVVTGIALSMTRAR